jgi:8-oxo-dGTP pyrophosphatase MutT (NUDIX family)
VTEPEPGTEPGTELRIRRSVRAVLIDSANRVLLVRFEFPAGTVWALPGGGVEPEEDEEATLRRELEEELGLLDVEIGPHIWNRLHIIPFIDGRWDGQRDQVHLVRTAPFEPQPRLSWDQLRAERLHEIRWWTLEEIVTGGLDGVWFAPRRLPQLLRSLFTDGPPVVPIDTGV